MASNENQSELYSVILSVDTHIGVLLLWYQYFKEIVVDRVGGERSKAFDAHNAQWFW